MIDTDDKTTLAAAVTDQSAVTRWDLEGGGVSVSERTLLLCGGRAFHEG